MAKKFKTENDYQERLNQIDYQSNMYCTRLEEVFAEDLRNVKCKTEALKQAEQLMALVFEKIKQHNAEMKRQTTIMQSTSYKRNNIEGFRG